MKINTSNDNLTNENSILKTNIILKDDKNINENNEDNFNISNSSYINNMKKNHSIIINNIKEKSVNNIILNNDTQEKFSEKVTLHTTQTNHGLNSLKEKITQKKIKSSNNYRNKKAKKTVKFKQNFVKIIEVKSFKKFYSNKYQNNDNCINCTCFIF